LPHIQVLRIVPMPSNDNKRTEAARARARRLIEQTPRVLAGLFVIGGLAYLAGSVYTRAYFAEFGASWILEEVPTAIYFSQSWIPLLLILFFGYLATTNLALYDSESDLTATKRFKVSIALVQYGPWCLIGLLVLIPLLSMFDHVTPVIGLSVFAIALLLLVLASALELLVIGLSKADPRRDFSKLYVAFAVLAVGLYVVPAQLGMNWARVDKDTSSKLLTVYLRGDETTEYKLLFAVDERWYVFPTRYEGDRPPVKAESASHVTFVPPAAEPK
jgi:hypothetical protein